MSNFSKTKAHVHVATAGNVSDGTISFNTPVLSALKGASMVVQRAGVVVAWDGVIAVAGNIVTVDNTGSVDWAAADVLIITTL